MMDFLEPAMSNWKQRVEIRMFARQGKCVCLIARSSVYPATRAAITLLIKKRGGLYGHRVSRTTKPGPESTHLESRIGVVPPRWITAKVLMRKIG
jgi:hypothetical protein